MFVRTPWMRNSERARSNVRPESWNDRPNDETQVLNGIVAPDRSPHPALEEVKKVYQPLGYTPSPLTSEQLGRSMQSDSDKFAQINDEGTSDLAGANA